MKPDTNMNKEPLQESKPSKPKSESNGASPEEASFIDEKELLKRIPVSRRTLWNYRESGKIPSVRLGGRRILFHWPSVEAALLRQQRGGNVV